jgi:Glucose-6-phosphate dehydrogenase, NAD binding domain
MSDQIGPGRDVLYYMEVPAQLFGRIAQGIAEVDRSVGARVMVEKPFGTDLASSQQLNAFDQPGSRCSPPPRTPTRSPATLTSARSSISWLLSPRSPGPWNTGSRCWTRP